MAQSKSISKFHFYCFSIVTFFLNKNNIYHTKETKKQPKIHIKDRGEMCKWVIVLITIVKFWYLFFLFLLLFCRTVSKGCGCYYESSEMMEYLLMKGGKCIMPENRGCGGGFGFGDDCCWIIIVLILICCCCGGGRGGCC